MSPERLGPALCLLLAQLCDLGVAAGITRSGHLPANSVASVRNHTLMLFARSLATQTGCGSAFDPRHAGICAGVSVILVPAATSFEVQWWACLALWTTPMVVTGCFIAVRWNWVARRAALKLKEKVPTLFFGPVTPPAIPVTYVMVRMCIAMSVFSQLPLIFLVEECTVDFDALAFERREVEAYADEVEHGKTRAETCAPTSPAWRSLGEFSRPKTLAYLVSEIS
jgi:hypothetical protein